MVPFAAMMMITAPLSARFVERLGTKAHRHRRAAHRGRRAARPVVHPDRHRLPPRHRHLLLHGDRAWAWSMAPATESVMGSLPREKAGVGSAVNDTTRQVGGALGVAVIGSIVASVYSAQHHRRRARRRPHWRGAGLGEGLPRRRPRRSASDLGAKAGPFVDDAKDALRGGPVEWPAHRRAWSILVAAAIAYLLPAGARSCRPSPSCCPPSTYRRRTVMCPPSPTESPGVVSASVGRSPPAAPAGRATFAPTGPSWRPPSSWPARSASARSPWTPSPPRPASARPRSTGGGASKEALVLDAWMACFPIEEVPDTGSLKGDLVANCPGPARRREHGHVQPGAAPDGGGRPA